MNNRKKIVITGASGFLGRHLIAELVDDNNYEVYALTSKPYDLKKQLGGENVQFIYKDSLDVEMLKNSIVINCAYPRNSIGTEIADGLKYIQKLFENSVNYDANAIINISSQSVYSQQRTEIATEETPICLESTYAVGKYSVELMLESICKERNTRYTNLRMASLIGPAFDQRIVNRFVKMLMNEEPVTIVQQPKRLGFIDVEDAVSAILSLVNIPFSNWKLIYTVGNGKGYTVEEIYNVVCSELKNKVNISNPSIEIGTDNSSTAVSYQHLNKDTGFIPKIDLKESVKRIIYQI